MNTTKTMNTAENIKRIMDGMWDDDDAVRKEIHLEIKNEANKLNIEAEALTTVQRADAGPMTFLGGRAANYDSGTGQPLCWSDSKEECTKQECVKWMLGYMISAEEYFSK